jgi:hypothetical protein
MADTPFRHQATLSPGFLQSFAQMMQNFDETVNR